MKVIELNKKFKNEEILKGITYTFKKNNIYGLVGRNGSGKSVFFKILSKFLEPTSGKIDYEGEEVNEMIELPKFIEYMTGMENIKLIFEFREGKFTSEMHEKVCSYMKRLNFLEYKDQKVYKYSQGMKQMLYLIKVLASDDKIILLDEPLNGIAKENKNYLLSVIKEFAKDKIVIISSHREEDIKNICNVIINIEDGEFII